MREDVREMLIIDTSSPTQYEIRILREYDITDPFRPRFTPGVRRRLAVRLAREVARLHQDSRNPSASACSRFS